MPCLISRTFSLATSARSIFWKPVTSDGSHSWRSEHYQLGESCKFIRWMHRSSAGKKSPSLNSAVPQLLCLANPQPLVSNLMPGWRSVAPASQAPPIFVDSRSTVNGSPTSPSRRIGPRLGCARIGCARAVSWAASQIGSLAAPSWARAGRAQPPNPQRQRRRQQSRTTGARRNRVLAQSVLFKFSVADFH